MPNWGLTPEMREARPWGLSADLLGPGKTITDPVHGDIHLTKLEVAVVDSGPFQRLRRVKQLGNTHLVYPGATHSRFSHSLGALRVAQDLLDAALDHRLVPGACPDVFAQWKQELAPDGRLEGDAAVRFDRRIAEAIVLARLGGLLHDLCHVPFGHSVEDELHLLTAHDENADRFDRLWAEMPVAVTGAIDGDLLSYLRPLVLSKEKGEESTGALQGQELEVSRPSYAFVADIVGNTICADLLDYLRRDHMFTGLPLALGTRFETGFYVQPDGDPKFSSRLVLRVVRADGRERTDVITEILKHLRYRYELSERALTHHAKVAADAMVGKMIEIWRDALVVELANEYVSSEGGAEWPLGKVPEDSVEGLRLVDPDAAANIETRVGAEIDAQLLRRGDDGFLEYMRDLSGAPGLSLTLRDASRRRAVGQLAEDLLERRLFKRVAHQRQIRQSRTEFCDEYRSPASRRVIEQRAARFAGVDPAWHVAVWVPPENMRLKVADVLVNDGQETRRFVQREGELYRRGADIYELHQQLWAVSVYVHPSVSGDQRERVLVSLSADLDMALTPQPHKASDRYVYAHPPHEWPDRLAIAPLREKHDLTEARVVDLLAARRARAARGDSGERPSLEALTAEYELLLD